LKRELVEMIIEVRKQLHLRIRIGRLKWEISYRQGWWYVGVGVWHLLILEADGLWLMRGSIWAGLGRSVYPLCRFGPFFMSTSVW